MAVEGDAMQGPSSPTSRRARAVVRDETKPLVLIAAVGVRPSAARTVLPPPVDPSQEDVILVMEEDGRRALGACRVGHVRTGLLRLLRLRDEAVHRPTVDVGGAVDGIVGTTTVAVGVVDVRFDALARGRVGNADGGDTVVHRDARRSRVGPEVGVEGPVLLEDDHDVLDLPDPARRVR